MLYYIQGGKMGKYLKIGKFHIATEILRKAIHEENKELLKQLKPYFLNLSL